MQGLQVTLRVIAFVFLWPPYVIGGHYIFVLWFLLPFFFFLA